jgi:nitrate/nitrite-specific signal transduction histidine kinase
MNTREFRKRRKYLIDRKFQLKYAGSILIFILVTFLIFSIVFYQAGFLPLIEKLKNVYPQARLFVILRSIYKQLIISFFLLLVVAFGFAIFRSHKIVGPLFRLKYHIHQMGEGNFSGRIKLRRKDELKLLADELNILSQNISLLVEGSRNLMQRMQLALDELHSKAKARPDEYTPLAETLSQLETEIEQFREILKQYKI